MESKTFIRICKEKVAEYFKFIRWEDEKIWSIRELKELKVEGNERD